tara:strand:- start:7979 stop:10354 length:2376 start_codon:yes stop_codon:yes gene_type:complete
MTARKATGAKPSSTTIKKAASKTTKRATSTVTKRKKLVLKKTPEQSDKVDLPENMSQRSIEKSLVLKREFDHLYRNYMAAFARVTGICFMLVGATAAALQVLPAPTPDTMSAQVASSSTTTTSTNVPIAPPTDVSPIGSIPSLVDTDIQVRFSANNTLDVKAKLRELGSTGFYDLPINQTGADTYAATIYWSSLPPAYYEFFIYAVPENGDNTIVYRFSPMQIGYPSPPQGTSSGGSSDNSSTTSSGGSGSSGSGISGSSGTNTSGDTSYLPNTSGGSSAITNTATSAPSGGIVTPSIPANSTNQNQQPVSQPVFSLFSSDDLLLTGTELIGINHPDGYTYIELYARPVNSANSRFITLATKRSVYWQFVVNSENIPNGDYEFFAQTNYNGTTVTSDSIRMTVRNSVTVTDQQPVYTTPVTTTNTSTPEPEPVRPTYVVTEEAEDFATSSDRLENDVDRETKELLREHGEEFKDLFDRYATAKQSDDETMIKLAEEAIQDKRDKLADSALYDERLQDIADNIDEQLEERLENVKRKIEAFEEIRKERTNGQSATDTDGDGVSDADEINLYNTDPTAADSDNDGINDGVEIVRGFNPVDAKPEAVIRFESPKETIGLTRNDVLQIEEVTPVRRFENPEDEILEMPETATEIRGKALPNSFVTLYIFSTPVVVTVKTDADGSFVYTFDKELEDGRHDVYVAVTDNTGEIIAQSSPFSFIKEAQAFTPVDAAEAEVVGSVTPAEDSATSYSLVIGIAILAFGLILLMLGISLRSKDSEEVIITETEPEIQPEKA